jgi:hypothetical protein
MSPLLVHIPSLWITYKENRPYPTTRAQCGLLGANNYKCNRHQQLNVVSEARARGSIFIVITPKRTPCVAIEFNKLLIIKYKFLILTTLSNVIYSTSTFESNNTPQASNL